MAYKEEEIDHVCDSCGKVTQGPHKGEIIREQDETMVSQPDPHAEYKGAPISHGGICEDCENEARSRGHPWWNYRVFKRPK